MEVGAKWFFVWLLFGNLHETLQALQGTFWIVTPWSSSHSATPQLTHCIINYIGTLQTHGQPPVPKAARRVRRRRRQTQNMYGRLLSGRTVYVLTIYWELSSGL